MFKWFKDIFSNEEENIEKKEEDILEKEKEEILEKNEPIFTEKEIESLEIKSNYNEPLMPDEIEELEEKFEEFEELEEKIDEIEEQQKEIQEEISKIEIEELEEAKEDIGLEDVKEIEDNSIKVEQEENIEEEKPKKKSMFQKLFDGLSKTRDDVSIKINTMLGAYVKIDDEMLEDLEDILISADIGMDTTMKLIDNLRESIIKEKVNDPAQVIPMLKNEAKKLMNEELDNKVKTDAPTIILVIGVNGVGKTTTIGKMSNNFKKEGKKVLVAAADTFRAAAIDQLRDWGNRAEVDIIAHNEGSDPAAVVFDAISAAKSRKTDVLICDTAGRLHNKANLMKELEKINRIIDREYPSANRETLLVLDATTGQNAMNQAKTFKEVCDITGIVLTKLDGTAKGGVVIALQSELQVPIKLIGVGEGIDDLQQFNIDTFLDAIFN